MSDPDHKSSPSQASPPGNEPIPGNNPVPGDNPAPGNGKAPRRTPSRGKLSVLAVAALVMALIPLCPPLNLLAMILGLLAYRRIDASRGRLRGLGLAQAAVLAGFILAVLSMVFWGRFAEAYLQRMTEGMISTTRQVIQAASDQDLDALKAHWTDAGEFKPTDEAIVEFGSQVHERYGDLQRVSLVAHIQEGVFPTRVEAAVIFHFAEVDLNGSIEMNLISQSLDLVPVFRFRSILIEDPLREDLVLPPVDEGS